MPPPPPPIDTPAMPPIAPRVSLAPLPAPRAVDDDLPPAPLRRPPRPPPLPPLPPPAEAATTMSRNRRPWPHQGLPMAGSPILCAGVAAGIGGEGGGERVRGAKGTTQAAVPLLLPRCCCRCDWHWYCGANAMGVLPGLFVRDGGIDECDFIGFMHASHLQAVHVCTCVCRTHHYHSGAALPGAGAPWWRLL